MNERRQQYSIGSLRKKASYFTVSLSRMSLFLLFTKQLLSHIICAELLHIVELKKSIYRC